MKTEHRSHGPVWAFVRAVLLVFLKVAFSWKFIGIERIPRRGPAIVAGNHIGYFDPLGHGLMVERRGRLPRFLAKAELWKNPFLRWVMNGCRQIKVERGTGEGGPVDRAVQTLDQGGVVVFYPEATVTTNPDLTPMRGKTGVARVAIRSGAPVVPVAIWGSHWVKPKKRKAVHKWRRLIMLKAGDPMTFGHLRGTEDDPEVLRDVTEQIMAELDRLVRELHKVYPEGAAVPELRE